MEQLTSSTSRRSLARNLAAGAFILLVLGWFFPGKASAQNDREYKVKVAYLYKMGMYVNRKGAVGLTDQSPLVIGILGKDPFGNMLHQIAAKRKIHDKTIEIKQFDSWDDYEDCHILFVTKTADEDSAAKSISETQGQAILLVGERQDYAKQGGVFEMYLDAQGKVGIKLNIDAAKSRGLQVDARFLNVCDIIQDTE